MYVNRICRKYFTHWFAIVHAFHASLSWRFFVAKICKHGKRIGFIWHAIYISSHFCDRDHHGQIFVQFLILSPIFPLYGPFYYELLATPFPKSMYVCKVQQDILPIFLPAMFVLSVVEHSPSQSLRRSEPSVHALFTKKQLLGYVTISDPHTGVYI